VTTATANSGYLEFYWANGTSGNFVNSGTAGSASDTAYYNNSGIAQATSLVSAKPVYTSPRGSKLTSFGTSSVQYQYATSLAHAKYYLQGSTNTTTGGASNKVAKVGDTIDMGADTQSRSSASTAAHPEADRAAQRLA